MTTQAFPHNGVLVALAIPTDGDGRLREDILAHHLSWLRSCDIHGVLALGSTGEFVRFGLSERKNLLERILLHAGSLPVIANISDPNPRHSAELGRVARDLGMAGVAMMPPFFYRVSEADQLAYFTFAAEASGLPVLLYNFPELTSGNRISLETVAAFADRMPLQGIKQSGKEWEYHKSLVILGQEKSFSVFTGSDTRLYETFAVGAAGCIGGMVNFMPEYMVNLFRICREKQPGDPEPSAERLREVGRWLDTLSFPLNIAAGMEARGLSPGEPKVIVSPQSRAIYQDLVQGLRTCFARWDLPSAPPLGDRKRDCHEP